MFKKLVFASLVLSLISFHSFSQKLNRETLGKIGYTQLPKNPLPEDYKTYKVEAKGAHDDLYRRDAIAGKIDVIGFSKSDNDDYQFKIKIEEYPFQYGESEKKEKVEKKKVDGVEKTYTYYYYVSSVSYKYNLKVVDKDGNSIFGKTFEGTEDIEGSTVSKSSDAYKSYVEKKKKIAKEILPKQVSNINNYINSEIGFPKKYHFVEAYLIKPKKHNYDDFDKAFGIFNQALEMVKADENKTTEAMEILKPAIELWETALEESDVENKKARVNEKVTCAALYNIATSYMICKDYPKAIEYYQKVKSYRPNFSNAHQMKGLAENLQSRVEANN